MHTAKYLKTKNRIVGFFIQKKIFFSMHLALITGLLKSREHWPRFKKQQKNLFFFVLIPGITNLYVKRIPCIKNLCYICCLDFFLSDIKTMQPTLGRAYLGC